MTLFLPRKVFIDRDFTEHVVEIGGSLDMLGVWVCLDDADSATTKFGREYARSRAERRLYKAGAWGPVAESLAYQPGGCDHQYRSHYHAHYTAERPITCAPAALCVVYVPDQGRCLHDADDHMPGWCSMCGDAHAFTPTPSATPSTDEEGR